MPRDYLAEFPPLPDSGRGTLPTQEETPGRVSLGDGGEDPVSVMPGGDSVSSPCEPPTVEEEKHTEDVFSSGCEGPLPRIPHTPRVGEGAALSLPVESLSPAPAFQVSDMSEPASTVEGSPSPQAEHSSPVPDKEKRHRRRPRWLLPAVAVACGGVVAIVGGVVYSATRPPVSPASPSPVSVAPPVPPASSSVVSSPGRIPGEVCNRPGDRRSLAGVVAQMQYLYYTRQDGAGVVGLFADPSPVAESIPAAIATQPAGQRWCLTTRPAGAGSVVATVVVTVPGSVTPQVFEEKIDGQQGPDGLWSITAISALGEAS